MPNLLFLILAIGFSAAAKAEISIKMTAPGSVPESKLYMLSGADSETPKKVAEFLAASLKDKIPGIEIGEVRKSDLKTVLTDVRLPITELNKIEYFSNKNQSQIFKIKVQDRLYQIHISASKDLALVVGSI